MIALGLLFLRLLCDRFKPPLQLETEILTLRHQLNILHRALGRPHLRWVDRTLLIWLYRRCPSILNAITVVRPETVLRWHRMGFAAYWRWKSRSPGGRPRIAKEVRDSAVVAGTERSIPLTSTRFHVNIEHGLAIVSTTRVFQNKEHESIEATITFPIPVHAVLFGLEARIDGRVLKAKAQRNTEARQTYEDALERGKTSVLHEEVLRGVHMLSVGHIPIGAAIEISATWTLSLTNIKGRGCLRIPLTVGDVYGRSGLQDSDGLIHWGPVQMGQLTVSCRDGQVTLRGRELHADEVQVPLNAPIDLEVSGWVPQVMLGHSADGRDVSLRIEPSPTVDAALNVALLIDHSGSMADRCSDGRKPTKHNAIVRGLQEIASGIGRADIVEIWEFNNDFDRVGSTQDHHNLKELVQHLSEPAGGTEIGRAVKGVCDQSKVHDILLVTDGKSHELDVQALARTGHRFSVVLVGEDSLEANVGHLAALTGGEIFVAAGADLKEVLNQALRELRTTYQPLSPIIGKPQNITVRRAGMTITASWQTTEKALPETTETRAIGAFAASLALGALEREAAAQLAESEGLVTHLTSLVLIDEAGAVQEGIPGARKVALPTPRTTLDMGVLDSPIHPMMDRMDRNLQSFAQASIRADLAKSQFKTSDLNLPEPFRRLVELIEDDPSRLQPKRIGKLLEEAGLRAEFEELCRHAQEFGLKAEAILSIVLADLLEGPLAQSLSPRARRASESLQEFAQRAKDIMRGIAGHGSIFMNEFQGSARLNLVQSGRADEIAQVVGRLAEWRRLLDHLEKFSQEQAEQLQAYKKSIAGQAGGTEHLDLSGIAANINWDLSPDRLRGGDLSAIDHTIAHIIQNAAANIVVRNIAQELGIDPAVLVLGLVARTQAPKNRTAERIAKAIFSKTSAEKLNTLPQTLCIK